MTEANNLVQRVWSYAHILRDDGVSYSDYIEQVTYLLFLKMADDNGDERDASTAIPKKWNWQSLVNKEGIELQLHYISLLEALGKKTGILGAIYQSATNKIQDPNKLQKIISMIDKESWFDSDIDVKGEIYEGILERNASDVKSGAGQYFTPRPLIRAIVEVMQPKPMEVICDPACGTGGFLIVAHDYITDNYKLDKKKKDFLRENAIIGFDIVSSVVRLCAMNLYLHGIGGKNTPVTLGDSLQELPEDKVDMVLANPPFGKKSSTIVYSDNGKSAREADSYTREDFWVTTSNKQLNFIQHTYSILDDNGSAALVLPDNVLFESGAGEVIRKKLLEECEFHTLLRLPSNIFYAHGVKANVVFFNKKSKQDSLWSDNRRLWIYDLRTNIHLSRRRNPLSDELLKDFVKVYSPSDLSKRKETERFKAFDYETLFERDSTNLDITWMKDDTLEDTEFLPDPEELAEDIVLSLKIALEKFSDISEALNN